MHLSALSIGCALFAAQAVARPQIELLSDAESGMTTAEVCRFSGKAAKGVLVVVADGQATMRLDGKLVEFKVAEVQCTTKCVSPGRHGTRTFRLVGAQARAVLSKPVFCHRDSEVCAGLPEGPASLTVSTNRGRVSVALWNPDCGF